MYSIVYNFRAHAPPEGARAKLLFYFYIIFLNDITVPAGEPAFARMHLQKVLEPTTGTLACRRLRHLDLGLCGLVGVIPASLRECHAMAFLSLAKNGLTGDVPGELLAPT